MLPMAIGFGAQEIIIVGGLVFLLFGAKKLPELGKSLAEGISEFKKASKKITEEDTEQPQKEEETQA